MELKLKAKKVPLAEIHRIFKSMVHKGEEANVTYSYHFLSGVGVSGFYPHGRKSKFVLWDAKSGETIATIDYTIRKTKGGQS